MTLHRTLLTHHSSPNWIRASSSVSCFPPPVIHDPQASASACAGIVARSQSSRISAAAPRTTLDVTADAGASGCPLLLAARPLQSSCKTRSLSRCHRAVDFGFQTLKSPTAIAAKVCGGRFPGSMAVHTSHNQVTTSSASWQVVKMWVRFAAAPWHSRCVQADAASVSALGFMCSRNAPQGRKPWSKRQAVSRWSLGRRRSLMTL